MCASRHKCHFAGMRETTDILVLEVGSDFYLVWSKGIVYPLPFKCFPNSHRQLLWHQGCACAGTCRRAKRVHQVKETLPSVPSPSQQPCRPRRGDRTRTRQQAVWPTPLEDTQVCRALCARDATESLPCVLSLACAAFGEPEDRRAVTAFLAPAQLRQLLCWRS